MHRKKSDLETKSLQETRQLILAGASDRASIDPWRIAPARLRNWSQSFVQIPLHSVEIWLLQHVQNPPHVDISLSTIAKHNRYEQNFLKRLRLPFTIVDHHPPHYLSFISVRQHGTFFYVEHGRSPKTFQYN